MPLPSLIGWLLDHKELICPSTSFVFGSAGSPDTHLTIEAEGMGYVTNHPTMKQVVQVVLVPVAAVISRLFFFYLFQSC